MSLIDQLASVRERAGLEPLPNPGIIQGFGAFDAPAPPYVPQNPPAPAGWLDDDPDAEEDEVMESPAPPPSPLVPKRARMPLPAPPGLPVSQTTTLDFQLVVADRKAAWKNREVVLSEGDEKAVRAIVLRAIQREVDAELAEVSVKRRRKDKRLVQTIDIEPSSPSGREGGGLRDVILTQKRKPGRPKKGTP